MKKYEGLEVEVIFFFKQDIITNSINESADDLGGWDNDWFAQGNG